MKHGNMSPLVGPTWVFPLGKAFDVLKQYIIPILEEESKTKTIYPLPHTIFRAFKEVAFDDVRVVILGMDPYHDGSATGIAFDNPKDAKISPSLRNILKEIEEDTGKPSAGHMNASSYLEHLPSQGVLLLNAALTVEKSKPESHLKIWEDFTKETIEALNNRHKRIVWVLWGKKAQKFKKYINPKHIIVESAHPSPFSYKLFKGCKCFTKVNEYLQKPISW